MRIAYLHASKFGNGASVAARFADVMSDRGNQVEVHHISQVDPRRPPVADLYVFSSPGRIGKPIRAMRQFIKRVELPAGSPYAVLTTEMQPRPEPADEPRDSALRQRVRPMMRDALDERGLRFVAEGVVHVTQLRGPLEPGWEQIVDTFAGGLPLPALSADAR